MISLIKKLLVQPYQPLNLITLNKSQLIQNYQELNSFQPGIAIAPILKSNAYGHGLIQIGSIIDQLQLPFIGVDSVYEAYQLKKQKIQNKILIIGAIPLTTLQQTKLPFQLTILDKTYLQLLKTYHKKSEVHLFIDTGMNREGVRIEELEEVLFELHHSHLKLVGVMTHLAIADKPHHPLTKLQIENFTKAKELVLQKGFSPNWFHIGGSDTLNWVDPGLVNLVRTGRVLYGIEAHHNLVKPILQLTSKIIQIKNLKKGECVGYDATFTAKKPATIAVLPIGYNDGVERRLSNKGVVEVKGVECPIIGLISMNIMAIDISKVTKPEIGDEVTIFSSQRAAKNSIENSANLAGVSSYELLVHLHSSTKRAVI